MQAVRLRGNKEVTPFPAFYSGFVLAPGATLRSFLDIQSPIVLQEETTAVVQSQEGT